MTKKTETPTKPIYNLDQAAKLLGISKVTLKAIMSRDGFPAYDRGFDKVEFDRYRGFGDDLV